MIAFLIHQRRLGVVFAGLVAWLVGFQFWHHETFTAPLDVPIALSSAGRVDQALRIRLDAPHQLQVEFSIGPRPRDEAMRLVGSRATCRRLKPGEACDVGVPLRWELSEASGRVVASGESETHGSSGWATSEIWRTVEPSIRVPVGSYRLTASILRDLPEFEGMTARLSLAVSGGGKVSYGWRSDLAFFGGLANLFLLLPLAGGFGMILIGQGLGDWLRRSRANP